MNAGSPVVLINGRAATVSGLARFASVNDGHFTVLQVRGGAARGVELHLERLVYAHRHLYDARLEPGWVRGLMRQAVAGHPDASLKVTATQADGPAVMTVVRPPVEAEAAPVSLLPVLWQRPVPDIKHVGTFPQIYYAREAERLGFHDALLTDMEGRISETTIANIAFSSGKELIWPDGPALPGITRKLLQRALGRHGSRTAQIRLQDLASYSAAVLANSTGITPVSRIAGYSFPDSAATAERLRRVYAAMEPELL